MNSNTKNVEVPDRFVCPLTLTIMKFPYRDSVSGRVYERAAILEWIWFGNATCPMSRKPLHPSNFSLDIGLMFEIQEWSRQHGYDNVPLDDSLIQFDKDELMEQEDLENDTATTTQVSSDITTLRARVLKRQQERFEDQLSLQNEQCPIALPRVPTYLQLYI